MATDLLARLAAEARPARRRAAPQLPLDPFSTAPFPARPPRPTTQNLALAGLGGTRCTGTTRSFPTDPALPLPIGLPEADAPAGLTEGDPATEAAQVGRQRFAGVRVPFYATVSATVITATAAVAASAGPAVFTPANATPERPAPSAAAAGTAALSLALPAENPTPVTPQTPGALLGGPAGLLVPEGALAQGSAIVARAKADAKTLGAQQPPLKDGLGERAAAAARGPIPAHATPPTAPAAPKSRPAAAPAAAAGSGLGARALSLAKGKLGDPYVWGAAGPNAFDCSGLVVWAFKQLGVALPHSSATLSTMGTPVSKAALQPGDLVFFYSPVSHVGIYAGNGMVLNATESGQPVQYTKLANMPFHNARRVTV